MLKYYAGTDTLNKAPVQKSFQMKKYKLESLVLKPTSATKPIPTISGPTFLSDVDAQTPWNSCQGTLKQPWDALNRESFLWP